MSATDPSENPEPGAAPSACVLIAAPAGASRDECAASAREHAPAGTSVATVEPTAAAVNVALVAAAPADVALLLEPCAPGPGWLTRLRAAARAETGTATASALADSGGPLALGTLCAPAGDPVALAQAVARASLSLRPRLRRAAGPCVYVCREALELAGMLDEALALAAAVEVDLAQRCLLSGLIHVAADDVAVRRLVAARAPEQLPAELLRRYPYLEHAEIAEAPAVLARALSAAASSPRAPLAVTIDARALEGSITGTHVHILELIRALALSGELELRVLIRERRIDDASLALLRLLPSTELLAEERIDAGTPATPVFHRPQQAFAAEDIEIATRLGERLVLSQLDLIAYANPGYFPDASAWHAFRRAGRRGIAAAERVVVFSEHTRRELIADELTDAERIRVIPPGLDHHGEERLQRPDGLEAGIGEGARPYLLCLGTDFRHKNRVFAMRMLAALGEQHGWEGMLVLAGARIENGSSRELERELLAARPELAPRVAELGAVSEPERVWLMRNAAAVVYPSVYEGFGLVPFESALNGVVCAFAAHSALAETAPEGTATIVPWDPSASAAALHALLTDESARGEHVRALADAARALRWADSAAAMAEVYREAAVAPVGGAATLSRDSVARERELTAAHEVVVRRLIGEREHAQGMYDALNREVGWGLSLIGPNGSLPQDVQRALLALNHRPTLQSALLAPLQAGFRIGRMCNRALARVLKRSTRP